MGINDGNQTPIDQLITVKELVRRSGIDEGRLRAWMQKRNQPLPVRKIGSAIMIDYDAFQVWLNDNVVMEEIYRLRRDRS